MEQASRGLEKIVSQSLRRIAPSEAPLIVWSLICGSVVADRTRAVSFDAGLLRVEVADAGWRSELQALAPRYLAGINRYTKETVSRIEFVVAPPNSGR